MKTAKTFARPAEAPDKTDELAIDGGAPVRSGLLPYGRHSVDDTDVAAMTEALRSGWLTTGPRVVAFEKAVAAFCGATEGIAVANGTAALHVAMHALGVGPGDEVIVPPMTFAATSNAVLYEGATPVFADVSPETLLLDPAKAEAKVTSRTRAIIAVDYAGQPCDYDALRDIARRRGLSLVADASHAIGGTYRGRPVGSLADLTTFSFHPVKGMTTGEGGMVVTRNPAMARRARQFRNHGISTSLAERETRQTWHYEMEELGFNYRLCDLGCALGMSQLARLPQWIVRRQAIAARYREALAQIDALRPLLELPDVSHAYHLFVVQLELGKLGASRDDIFKALRAEGIGANVHYIPVHLHPFYRRSLGTAEGLCPAAEAAFGRILTLPLFPEMTDHDVDDVVRAVSKITRAFRR